MKWENLWLDNSVHYNDRNTVGECFINCLILKANNAVIVVVSEVLL